MDFLVVAFVESKFFPLLVAMSRQQAHVVETRA